MKRSGFNLSHLHSMTLDMGNLVPCCVIDCLPNDTFKIQSKAFLRMQPMLAPVMHDINVFTQFWFVPYRLLWNEWTDFITGGETGNDDVSLTFPTIKAPADTGFAVGSLADYFGLPVNQPEIEVSALPFRAMAEIWNTRYRDEDLQKEIPISYDSGLDITTSTQLLKPAWKRDFATTARPFTQRGAQVSVPVIPAISEGSAYPVYSPILEFGEPTLEKPAGLELGVANRKNYSSGVFTEVDSFSVSNQITTSVTSGYFTFNLSNVVSEASGVALSFCNRTVYIPVTNINWGNPVSYSANPLVQLSCVYSATFNDVLGSGILPSVTCDTGLGVWDFKSLSGSFTLPEKVELGSKGAINIRDLRTASALQRYAERSLKYGNRYEEFIQREFGISPRDARIQRPEHIGSGKGRLVFSEVLQTAEGTGSQVGTMYGHGVGGINQRPIKFKCPEHGVIIGLLSVRPKSVYSQGIDRMWLKRTKLDYFVPELAHIGMQEVYQQELFANKDNKGEVFGYQDRNYEYRTQMPRVCGELRSNLDFWTMARKWEKPPVLNSSFIEMNPTKRIFGVTSQNVHSIIAAVQNIVHAYRVVPKRASGKL